MTLEKTIEALNRLAWQEHVAFEVSEDSPGEPSELEDNITGGLHRIGQTVTPDILDALQREPGYTVWALRLSPHVAGDQSRTRASGFIQHPDSSVRFWAAEIISGRAVADGVQKPRAG
jgi:hypothetical protein